MLARRPGPTAEPSRRMRQSSWLRTLGRLALLLYFLLALLVLFARYAVIPHIEDYRPEVEQLLAASLQLPVTIDRIDARWSGLRPRLTLAGLKIHDAQGRPALNLEHAEAELAWRSLLYFQLRLHHLEIFAPDLDIRRSRTGQLTIAGLPVDLDDSRQDNDLSDWLLHQGRIVIRDARIRWNDEKRAAPPLVLEHLYLQLQNQGTRHRFGLTAMPPRELASALDVRGDFRGRDLSRLDSWKGQAYAALGYADLAAWQAWIDYPVELPQGSAALRLWLNVERQQLSRLTADVVLQDARIRLAPDLPALDLAQLSGRLIGTRTDRGYALEAQRLSLASTEGLVLQPTNFRASWQIAVARQPTGGSFAAQKIDFAVLQRFSAYLPLPQDLRQQLTSFSPQGQILELNSGWSGKTDGQGRTHAEKYSFQARFADLGVNAHAPFPGVSGLSGQVQGSQDGGRLELDSQEVQLDMPMVFDQPRLDLGRLTAHVDWQLSGTSRRVRILQAQFDAPDAAGQVQGSYSTDSAQTDSPGQIDLTAHLSRGAGNAVWRYIPLAVDHEVRDWLQTSILDGLGADTRLRLQGDLKDFPFAEGGGLFSIQGQIKDGVLRYADAWPQIEKIQGHLDFTGRRMLITADSGRVFGVELAGVTAEIPALDAAEPQLFIKGQAQGPTADFLRFIEASPVGEKIDHFTADMRAEGKGLLDLNLQLPLAHLDQARINGNFRFVGNRVTVDPDLPALTDVYGRLQFTGEELKAEKLRARLLGNPLQFDLATTEQGDLRVNIDGQLKIADMRQQLAHPLLDRLSGSSPWRGVIRARKNQMDVDITSDLRGISSSLPEPFNKTAASPLALHFQRNTLAPPTARNAPAASTTPLRDQLQFELGSALRLQLQRRRDQPASRDEPAQIERGSISIGLDEALSLPSRGVQLRIDMPLLDLDLWQRLLISAQTDADSAPPGKTSTTLPVTTLDLKTAQLRVYGQQLNALEAHARRIGSDAWQAELKSQDATGVLSWKAGGAGRLGARLKWLSLNPATNAAKNDGATSTTAASNHTQNTLPALDIEVDKFTLRGKALGRLQLQAENQAGSWLADLNLDNEDGQLNGKGRWQYQTSAKAENTQLDFKLQARSIEHLLGRLGYAEAVRRGKASLNGQVSWRGTPFAIDYPSLSGDVSVSAENGQFNQLEPGVGRLLGILSLQSLPRRITLDFRDIFSQGFAFDSIQGQLSLKNGRVETQDLQIRGPSAKVLMSGSASIPQETQDIKVRVQPAVGESLAVGAMIANPAAGAIVWLAQKALKDPLDQAFAFEYAITGSWADPKVEKLAAPTASVRPPAALQTTPGAP